MTDEDVKQSQQIASDIIGVLPDSEDPRVMTNILTALTMTVGSLMAATVPESKFAEFIETFSGSINEFAITIVESQNSSENETDD